MKMKSTSFTIKTLFYIFVVVFLIVQIYPILWIMISSFKQPQEFISKPPYSLPDSLYLGNYIKMLTSSIIPKYFLNSTIVAFATITGIVILGSMAAYAIEKMEFKFSKQFLSFFLAGIMIPIFVTLIPMFRIYNTLHLRNTYTSLILPQIGFGLPMCVYLFTAFLRYIPNSILESAILDGASSLKIYLNIILPISKNTIVTIVTFNFIFVWNEFTFANTFLTSNMMKTIPVGLNDFVGLYGRTDWGATFASITATILPTLIIYFILNKNVIQGMAAGAVKS